MGDEVRNTKGKVGKSSVVRFDDQADIDAAIGDVFARLTDLPGYRQWMHRTGLFRRCAWTEDESPAVGARYTDTTRMGTFRGEVTGLDSPSRVAFRETLRWPGGATVDASMEYVLEANQGRTTVHHVARAELRGWMRFMRPAVRLMARTERKRTLRSLSRSFG